MHQSPRIVGTNGMNTDVVAWENLKMTLFSDKVNGANVELEISALVLAFFCPFLEAMTQPAYAIITLASMMCHSKSRRKNV